MGSLVPKLTILICIYTGLYFLFSAWTIVTDVKDREPWWDIAASAIFLPLGGVGILLYTFQVSDPGIKSTWKVVGPLLVAGLLFANLVSRQLALSGKSDLDPEEISQGTILGADLMVVVLLGPMFVLNILFGFA